MHHTPPPPYSKALIDAALRVQSSPEFDAGWYTQAYPDVLPSGLPPHVHFASVGDFLHRPPGSAFDPAAYAAANRNSQTAQRTPFLHYLRTRTPQSPLDPATPPMTLLSRSGFLDPHWYACEYRDVWEKRYDAAWHYFHHGASERRDPGPHFQTAWYVTTWMCDGDRGTNPVLHYLLKGQWRGATPTPPAAQPLPWWHDSLDAPRPMATAHPASKSLKTLLRLRQAPPAVVVIPVYNAPGPLAGCLAAVVRNTPLPRRILLLDDASTDPAVRPILEAYAGLPGVELHRHQKNRGFTRTANHGMDLAGQHDVLLLNADTQPGPRWLTQLRLAAYSSPKVGSATPFSNNAGAFSAPEPNQINSLPPWQQHDAVARAVAQASRRLLPEAPTGNGFCLYLRRDCLEDTGLFDADAFPRGYGEENDWCQRATGLGWTHVVDDATHVAHVRSASFSTERAALLAAGQEVLQERYPNYAGDVQAFMTSPELTAGQARVGQAIRSMAADRQPVRPRILFVVSTKTGGTPQTNQDLMRALGDRYECFVLQSSHAMVSLWQFDGSRLIQLRAQALEAPISPMPHRDAIYDAAVAQWLCEYAFELVHVRHLAWHSLTLLELCSLAEVPVLVSFHDFYAICPSAQLLRADGTCCHGDCQGDVQDCPPVLWPVDHFPDVPREAHQQSGGDAAGRSSAPLSKAWREQFAQTLRHANAFVTTSPRARAILQTHLPSLKERPFHVIPHGRSFSQFLDVSTTPEPGAPLRLLLPGTLTDAKGARVVAALAALETGAGASRNAAAIVALETDAGAAWDNGTMGTLEAGSGSSLDAGAKATPGADAGASQHTPGALEIHILGAVRGELTETLASLPNVIIHGPYAREHFQEHVAAIAPHLGGVLSPWPETYSHTVTELWACGVPVVGFDLGAVGERISATGGGWLAPTCDAAGVAQVLHSLRKQPELHAEAVANVLAWQRADGRAWDATAMSHAYDDRYRALLQGQSRQEQPAMGGMPVETVPKGATPFCMSPLLPPPTVGVLSKERVAEHSPKTDQDTIPAPSHVLDIVENSPDRPVRYDVLSQERIRQLLETPALAAMQFAALLHEDGALPPEAATVLNDAMAAQGKALLPAILEDVPALPRPHLWLAPLGLAQQPVFGEPSLFRQPGESLRLLLPQGVEAPEWLGEILHGAVGVRVFALGHAPLAWAEPLDVPEATRTYPDWACWLRRVCQTMDAMLLPWEADSPPPAVRQRAMEAAAMALPCLSSEEGAETSLLAEHVAGGAGNTPLNSIDYWRRRLERAQADPIGLKAIALSAQARCLQHVARSENQTTLDGRVLDAIRQSS